jgi:hypothetical protein
MYRMFEHGRSSIVNAGIWRSSMERNIKSSHWVVAATLATVLALGAGSAYAAGFSNNDDSEQGNNVTMMHGKHQNQGPGSTSRDSDKYRRGDSSKGDAKFGWSNGRQGNGGQFSKGDFNGRGRGHNGRGGQGQQWAQRNGGRKGQCNQSNHRS